MAENVAVESRRLRRWPRHSIVLAPLIVLLPGGLWTWVARFSRKGWICKTYEGELAQYVVGGVPSRALPQAPYFAGSFTLVSGER